MKCLTTISLILLSTSCAIPYSHETDSTSGRIFKGEKHSEASNGKPSGETAFMVDGTLLVLPIGNRTKATYLYAIKTNDGRIITTQSSRKYKNGKCVKLHHPKLVWDEESEFNFVAGTLTGSFDCN